MKLKNRTNKMDLIEVNVKQKKMYDWEAFKYKVARTECCEYDGNKYAVFHLGEKSHVALDFELMKKVLQQKVRKINSPNLVVIDYDKGEVVGTIPMVGVDKDGNVIEEQKMEEDV